MSLKLRSNALDFDLRWETLMKVIYCVLELGEAESMDRKSVAFFANVPLSSVIIMNLAECTSGNRKRFAMLTDLYLWTCKYWYGTFEDKLTFVEIRGIDNLPMFFSLKYVDKIRFAIASEKLSIFSEVAMVIFKQATYQSMAHFNEKRIEAIAAFIPKLEESYRILWCERNPFRNQM